MPGSLNALLVEDSISDAALVERMLRQTGRGVVTCRVQSATELRAALLERAWDIVIADYQLPGFSAPAALEIVQEDGRDIPFIVVSGTIGEAKAVAMMKAGAQDYLMKSNLPRLAPAVIRELAEARNRRARREAEAAQRELQTRLLESQRDAYTQLSEWHRRLELVKDEERRSLSRELHDGMGQSLTALKLALKRLGRAGDAPPVEIASAVDLVDDLIARVRKIAVDLRPPLLDELGLEAALGALVESTEQLGVLKLHLALEGLTPRLTPELEMACYRVVQEAVTNVLRHAAASNTWIAVARTDRHLTISVDDDGVGISHERVAAQAKAGHLGVVGMRERANALGGSLTILSPRPDASPGTRIAITLPIQEMA